VPAYITKSSISISTPLTPLNLKRPTPYFGDAALDPDVTAFVILVQTPLVPVSAVAWYVPGLDVPSEDALLSPFAGAVAPDVL
jgi:hypothetical protein